MLVSGIGCGSKLPHYMTANGYNSIHGRALPVAQGIKLANHDLNVIAVTGDGDGYGIGQGHFIHAMRRNADITHIVENNQVYGLTKGQYSPDQRARLHQHVLAGGGHRVRDQPDRAGARGGRDVHRAGFGRRPEAHEQLLQAGDPPPGLLAGRLPPAVRDLQQDQHLRLVQHASTSSTRRRATTRRTARWPRRGARVGEKIPMGVIYRGGRPTYEEQVPALANGPLVKQPLDGHSLDEWEKIKGQFV